MTTLRACLSAVVVFQLVLLVAGSGTAASTASLLSLDSNAAKSRPVSKVIVVLKDMLTQLEKEADEDKEIFDKIACWCETNEKEKTKAIADATEGIASLEAKIEQLTGLGAQLAKEVKTLEKEIFKSQESQDEATALRAKQQEEFNSEEKEMVEAISALKSAIIVLSKHEASSFLQTPITSGHLGLVAALQHQLQEHGDLFKGALTVSQQQMVLSFVQAPGAQQSYNPQSGQILGILTQMKETFEANLAASQKEEGTSQGEFGGVKGTIGAELDAANESREKKVQELADTDEKLASSKQGMADTAAQKAADEEFLAMLKEKCATTDTEFEERQKTRSMEVEAVSKALGFLTSDDAHDLFSKTFNPALLQTLSASHKSLRRQASELLNKVARHVNSPRLVALAYEIRLDAFTTVKKEIDKMISQLLKEMADEVKHKDFCVAEFNTNQLNTEKKEREKSGLEAKVEGLETSIDELGKELVSLKAEIAEMRTQMKRAGEDREIENKSFQLTVADQRATQKLLTAALAMLKDFYAEKSALVQRQNAPAGPPLPPGFEDYDKNESAGGVMQMIMEIINDAKKMEAEAITGEEDAQTAYEGFVKETNASIDTATKQVVNKTEEKAKAETELAEAQETLESVELELEDLSSAKGQLHGACDFVMKNFDLRQSARGEEIEGLKQAKQILSGAKFDALLQSYGAYGA